MAEKIFKKSKSHSFPPLLTKSSSNAKNSSRISSQSGIGSGSSAGTQHTRPQHDKWASHLEIQSFWEFAYFDHNTSYVMLKYKICYHSIALDPLCRMM